MLRMTVMWRNYHFNVAFTQGELKFFSNFRNAMLLWYNNINYIIIDLLRKRCVCFRYWMDLRMKNYEYALYNQIDRNWVSFYYFFERSLLNVFDVKYRDHTWWKLVINTECPALVMVSVCNLEWVGCVCSNSAEH